jgi:Flp pilus assembly protein TadB
VTEEFIDLEARIRTQKALEAQFLEIMKQARSVEDALEVQRQLAEVRGEIEKVEGRRKFLENQTNFSTITVTINTPTVFAAASSGFGAQLWRAFSEGIDAALFVILGLIRVFLAFLPLLILFGIPIWLVVRHFRKKWRRAKLAQQFAQEEKN